MRLIRYSAIGLLISIILSGCGATRISSIYDENNAQLSAGEGYLLISINSDRNFGNFIIDGPKKFNLNFREKYNGKYYFLAALPAGEYGIQRFGSYWSYYTFDDDEELWRFQVKPNVISYVGELRIKSIGYGYSKFELLNNSSMALEYIQDKFPNLLSTEKISYTGPGQDDFFEYVLALPLVNVSAPQTDEVSEHE